jgi:hypothetical protein
LAEHVRSGERLLMATVGLVMVAILARAATGYIEEGKITAMLLPTSLHGWTGPLGLWVLWTTVRHGRQALASMEAKESSVAPRTRHGRAADLMLILVGVHAFLGFLYTFAVLS